VPLSDKPRDDSCRRKRKGSAGEKGGGGRQSGYEGQQAQAHSTREHLDGTEAEDVAGLLAHGLQREVQPDVEEQEHDAELGEDRDGRTVGQDVQPACAQA
jgi:hypothetical protein